LKMKIKMKIRTALTLAGLLSLAGSSGAAAVGTSFTYQGRLNDQGVLANGTYDLSFRLCDAVEAGAQWGATVTNLAVVVSNGIFVVVLDFGADAFDGNNRWLEVAVRKGTNDFTVLSPRQLMTPVPYAMMAAKLSGPLPERQLPEGLARLSSDQTLTGSNTFSGVVTADNPANSFQGTFQGNGAGLTNVNASVVMAATNDLNLAWVTNFAAATNASWTSTTNLLAAATNDLNVAISATIMAATNAPWIASTNGLTAATNHLDASLSLKLEAATNTLWTATTNLVVAATNHADAAWSAKLAAATNALWIGTTNEVVAATNDLNAIWALKLGSATNAPWIASTNLVATATNDLNTAFVAKLVAATNAAWLASTNWVASQGYQLTNGLTRKPISVPVLVNGTNYVLDFSSEVVQLTATNDVALSQSTNHAPEGWYAECVWYIQGGTTNCHLLVNTNWIGVGSLAATTPYLITSNKLTIVAFSSRGSSETNVSYAIARQE
jgi:hypothetical protein